MRQTPENMKELLSRVKGKLHLKSLVIALSAIVVFTTTYLLILPAFTLDKDEAADQGGIDVVAVETAAETADAEDQVEEEKTETEAAVTEEKTEAKDDSKSDTTAKTETKADAAKQDKKDDVKLIAKKTTITAEKSDSDDFAVSAVINKDAKVPEDTVITATELDKKTEDFDYEQYKKDALAALKKDSSNVAGIKSIKFYDISLESETQETSVEPAAPVNVKIEYEDGMKVDNADNVRIVHFAEQKNGEVKAEVLDNKENKVEATVDKKESKLTEASFETDGFSVYAIVGTETITTQYIDHKGTKYEVTVTYGPDAKIPEGSTLSVTDIEEGTDAYDYARNAVLADKKEKGETVNIDTFNLAALDISIIDPNGQEIEPEASVTVDIKIKDLPGVENLNEIKETLEIQHHVEVADGVVIEKVFDGNIEGSYKMDTDENVAKTGTTVDPASVTDEDFKVGEANEDDLVASFDVEDFSTYTISWNYNRTSTTVHYGYMNGNTFVEFTEQPSPVNVTTNYRTYLLYDFDGYTYSGNTYYRTTASNTPATGGTRIQAQLRYIQSNWRYHSYSTSDSNNNWQAIANNSHIYVTYNPETTPTTGGTPEIEDVSPEDWPQDPQTPVFSKSSTKNTDGTNTVSLSINGGEREIENSTKANVIVVLDVSGSMGGNNIWRLNTAKNAIYDMADTLLNDMSGVKMALITFSTTSSSTPVQGFTDNYTTFYNAVRGLTANGGTNWEQALFNANRLEVDDDAATFVVFVTDGDPTYRISRYNAPDSELYGYNREDNYFAYNVFGAGNSDPNDRAFDAAAEEVSSILANNKSFYAIGVSSDVTKVQDLVDEAGGGKAFLATNATALEEAFANITQSIKTTLGFGDVEITDGITELSNVEMKMMHEVDPDSFTYYKVTSSGQNAWDPASEGAGLASYDEETGAVKWDLGEGFQLEDGVTYMVTFRVWPSQEAYDLIADLNNGVKVYASGQPNSITDEEREQIQELAEPTATSQGRYTLKTNTNTVNATYSQTSSTGETVTVSGETDLTATYDPGTIENMDLESMKLTVKKVFEDDLTSGEDRETEVKLILKRRNAHQTTTEDFVPYAVPQTGGMSSEIVLNEGNNWTYSFYVAPGFEVDGEVLEHGYDFTITEPDIDYHYGLIEEIINPMVVDGQDKYYGDGELINGETIDQYTDQSLTAVNRVKSGIDIEKHVYDVDGTTEIYPETEFTITGQLLGPDGQPYTWQDGDDVNASGAYHKYDKDGNRIVYKGHFADSSNITFTLKAGERIRFINVPDGCTFQFTESTSGMDALGYEWMSTDAVTQHRTEAGGDFVTDGDVQPVVSGQTASLPTGVVGNKQYAVTYENKRTIELPDVELVKVDKDDNAKKLNDAEFTLYSDAELTTPVTVDGNGNPISIKTGNKEGSAGPDGWYHIGLLPAGTYYMVETAEPDGYVLDETPIVITITKGSDTYSVSAVKNGANVLSGPTDGVYTITVDNARASKYIKVFKYETGTNPEKALEGAEFSLTGPEGTGISYTGLTTNADGYLVYSNSTLLELPVNDSSYTLTETKAPDGYNMMTENVVFTVTAEGVTATGSGYSVVSGTEPVDGTDVTVYTIKVQNSAGVELPNSGGIGTTIFYILGSLLVIGCGIVLVARRRMGADK